MRTLFGTFLGFLFGAVMGGILAGVGGALIGAIAMAQLSTVLTEYSQEKGWSAWSLPLLYAGPAGGALVFGVLFYPLTGRLLGAVSGLVLGAVVSAVVSLRIDRQRRPQPGHCRVCGYNLTGNMSGVCPECGTGTSAC